MIGMRRYDARGSFLGIQHEFMRQAKWQNAYQCNRNDFQLKRRFRKMCSSHLLGKLRPGSKMETKRRRGLLEKLFEEQRRTSGKLPPSLPPSPNTRRSRENRLEGKDEEREEERVGQKNVNMMERLRNGQIELMHRIKDVERWLKEVEDGAIARASESEKRKATGAREREFGWMKLCEQAMKLHEREMEMRTEEREILLRSASVP